MRVIGITMVRNEQDVIDHVVRHMLNQDLDDVVVMDNLSTDDTWEILNSIEDKRLTIGTDDEPAYYQSEKMTRLAQWCAKPGDWIVPFDADELWCMSDGRSLAEGLRATTLPVAAGRPWTHVPQPDLLESGCPFMDMPWRSPNREVWPKAALRWGDDMIIEQGNHWTTSRVPDIVDIRHFQYRSYEHYVRKVEAGRVAMELTDLPYNSSEHWRCAAEMDETQRMDWWADYTGQQLVLDPPECRA